jgi:hypothetical protein
MASTLNASTSGAGGVITTADSSGVLQLQTAGTTAVTVDASQNVGIGTTSPSTYSAKFAIKTSDQDVIGFVGGTTYGMRFGANSSFAVIDGVDAETGTSAYNPLCMRGSQLLFNTAGTERMRIDSSGNVLIGATSFSGGVPNDSAIVIRQDGFMVTRVSGNGNYAAEFQNVSGTGVGNITVNSGSTQYITSSDYRLKENIVPMTGALDKVAQLKPVTYTWKQDGSDGQGFIAHELQAVVPDAVVGEKDAVDEDGNPKYQGIDTSFLVATLTAAIQEQQTIINDLKARIETLEAK